MNRMEGQLRLYGIVILSISFFFLRGGGRAGGMGEKWWPSVRDTELRILQARSNL